MFSYRKMLSLALASVMVLGNASMAFAGASTDPGSSAEREAANAIVSENAAMEGMVLLDNASGVLPITQEAGAKVALYGTGSYATIKGGTGSGDVYLKEGADISVLQGFQELGYEVVNADFLADRLAEKLAGEEAYGGTSAWGSYVHNEPVYDEAAIDEAAAQTDLAIYVLARNSGEGSDRAVGEVDYYLSKEEAANLALLGQKFENVVVVLNVGGIVDTNFYNGFGGYGADDEFNRGKIEGLDALFLMSQAGQNEGYALAKVLNGTVNPSGKLTDTWAINIEDYPSTAGFSYLDDNVAEEYYTDDIYVGYRYFDTFGKEVAYPFGYGGSYTTFDIAVDSVEADAGKVSVTASVTNTGEVDGKEVVEVYFSAPAGALDKPFQELAGYQKVAVAPGATETVTVSFDTADMSSYDEAQEAYVLEAGDYTIRVGNSSRNTVVAATITLDEAVITEEAQNQLGLTKAAMKDGSYSADEMLVLNNIQEESVGEDGETSIVNVPTYEPIALDMLDASSEGYGTGIEPTADGLSAEAAALTLAAADFETVTHTYTGGVVTTYVSSDPESDSAKYAEGKEDSDTEKFEVVEAAADATLADVVAGKITAEQLVASMSNVELADLMQGGTYDGLSADSNRSAVVGGQADSVYGAAGETTSNLYASRLIPNIVMSDGPAGVRITNSYIMYDLVDPSAEFDPDQTYYTGTYSWSGTVYEEAPFASAEEFSETLKGGMGLYTTTGTVYYQYCTAFPIGTLLAQTWDPEVVEMVGRAIGVEMLEYGVTSFLAPGMNIHRNPLCGRNFEYYSEDPLLAGKTAAAESLGISTNEDGTRTGVDVTLKHFAFNNQENDRMGSNSVVSERAAREIYLKGFEVAVKDVQPDYIMSSYNMVNGTSTFENYGLLTGLLRDEWGFEGMVMTDWYSVWGVRGKNADKSVQALLNYAGNDCEMPGGNVDSVLAALEDGSILRLGDLQKSCLNMIHVMELTPAFENALDLIIANSDDADGVATAQAAKEAVQAARAAE